MPLQRNLVGERFGRLTVTAEAGRTPRNRVLWLCQCSCGGSKVTTTSYLRSGDTQSCGCLKAETTIATGRAKKVDLAGKTFGRLAVISESGRGSKGGVRWLCQCSCGQTATVLGSRLTGGHCLSCGCLRLELQRARAAAVGSAKRAKMCRTCGRVYVAVGPQKECSEACRLRRHAQWESRRREAGRLTDLAVVAAELNRRLERG